jgi:hypothetical protein
MLASAKEWGSSFQDEDAEAMTAAENAEPAETASTASENAAEGSEVSSEKTERKIISNNTNAEKSEEPKGYSSAVSDLINDIEAIV